MNDKTVGGRLPRAGALAVAAAVAVLTTACGVHVHFGSSGGPASAGSVSYRQALAYAQCMQAHGLPNFPDPNPSRSFSVSGHPNGNNPVGRAYDACKDLLSRGNATAPTTAGPPGAVTAD
jgi:hypothetical protein